MTTAADGAEPAVLTRGLLLGLPVLKLLTPEQLDRVVAASRLVAYPKRSALAMKGQSVDHLGFLVSGKVQVVDYLPDGREFGLNLIQAGGFFGELSVIDRLPRSATLIALLPSTVVQVPGELARRLFFAYPPVAEAMMRHLASTIRRMSALRALQSIPGAHHRVYALLGFLMEVSGSGGPAIEDVPTHQEIAIMVNTSRETVTRALARLVARGIVRKERRRLLILRPAEFSTLLESGDEG